MNLFPSYKLQCMVFAKKNTFTRLGNSHQIRKSSQIRKMIQKLTQFLIFGSPDLEYKYIIISSNYYNCSFSSYSSSYSSSYCSSYYSFYISDFYQPCYFYFYFYFYYFHLIENDRVINVFSSGNDFDLRYIRFH